MGAGIPPTWVYISSKMDDSKPCHSGTNAGRGDMGLQQVSLTGERLPSNKHLVQRGGFVDYTVSTSPTRGLDGETLAKRNQINYGEPGLFIIGREDDGERCVHTEADSLMHSNLIPCTARRFVNVDMMSNMVASPLNDRNKTCVRIGSPIKENLEGDLSVDNGRYETQKVIRGNL